MYELPASVRLALWVTHAIRYRTPLEDAVHSALPDVDSIDGSVERFALWRDLGERVVCVDLPRPGVHGGLLPAGSPGAIAAMEAGECLFVPSLGGTLVPRLWWFGPEGDEGLAVRFEAFDSDPVPVHRLDMLDLPQVDRRFREALIRDVAVLERLDVEPFAGSEVRARADDRIEAARWALPPGLPPRALALLIRAGIVAAAIDEALAQPQGLDATATAGRDKTLRQLLAEAELAMAEAATVAALSLGGLR